MTLQQLRYAVTVAENASMNKAAQALFIDDYAGARLACGVIEQAQQAPEEAQM